MNGVLGHNSALEGYTGLGKTWANEMSVGMNHAPGAGSIARPADLQTSALILCHGCLNTWLLISSHQTLSKCVRYTVLTHSVLLATFLLTSVLVLSK